MAELTLSLHLKSFPKNGEHSQVYHLTNVHDSIPAYEIEINNLDGQHRESHFSGPQHGFKRGVPK